MSRREGAALRVSVKTIGPSIGIGTGPLPDAKFDGDHDFRVNDGQPNERAALPDEVHKTVATAFGARGVSPLGEQNRFGTHALVSFPDDASQRRFLPLIEATAEVHGVSAGLPMVGKTADSLHVRQLTIVKRKPTVKFAGEFYPNGGWKSDGALQTSPFLWAGSVSGQPGSDQLAFLHEWGHRVDYSWRHSTRGDGSILHGGDYVSKINGVGKRAQPEWVEFLHAAVDNAHFAEAMRRRDGDAEYQQYFSSVAEVWARAYAQWMAMRLDGKMPKVTDAFHASLQTDDGLFYQWPQSYFESHLAPKVEAILRARGIMP